MAIIAINTTVISPIINQLQNDSYLFLFLIILNHQTFPHFLQKHHQIKNPSLVKWSKFTWFSPDLPMIFLWFTWGFPDFPPFFGAGWRITWRQDLIQWGAKVFSPRLDRLGRLGLGSEKMGISFGIYDILGYIICVNYNDLTTISLE